MNAIFDFVREHPGRSILFFVGALTLVAIIPAAVLERLTFWRQSPDWARFVFQIGSLLLVLAFGLIPLIKWYEERIQAIVEKKPIIVTDCLEDSHYVIRNIGDAPALNAWIVIENHPAPIPLGALDANQSLALTATVVTALKGSTRHITLAFSRFPSRPYTPTYNVWNHQWGCYTHGFRRTFAPGSVMRGGPVNEYLNTEQAILLADLKTFSA